MSADRMKASATSVGTPSAAVNMKISPAMPFNDIHDANPVETYTTLVKAIGSFATILPMSVLFGLAHSDNLNFSWLALVNTVLWGIVLGYAFLLSGDTRLPKLIGLKASRRTPLFNGALECRLYEYRLVAGSMRQPRPAETGDDRMASS